MKRLVTGIVLTLLAATACAPYQMRPETAPPPAIYAVEFKPVGAPPNGELKPQTDPQGYGKGGKKKGYVGFGEDVSGFLVLAIKDKGKNSGGGDDLLANRCPGADEPGTADWVITRVSLSAEGDPDTEKGEGFGEPQPEWLQQAFPDVDLGNGVVYTASVLTGSSVVVLRNDNAQTGEENIYYEVVAESCDQAEPETATTDPMVRNKGK